MSLTGSRIVLVTSGGTFAESIVRPLRTDGSEIIVCAPDRDLWSVLASSLCDAIVIIDEGELWGLARALEEEPRTRSIPAFLVRQPGMPEGPPPGGTIRVVKPDADLVELLEDAIGEALQRRLSRPKWSIAPKPSAGVAHDVRALLGIVVGFAANLRDEIEGSLDEKGRENARKIVSAATDASALLEPLLPGDGETDSDPPPRSLLPLRTVQRTHFEFVGLVRKVKALFEDHARDRGVTIHLRAVESIHLWGELFELKQVITNLLANAIKFTPAGGHVSLSVQFVDGIEDQDRAGRRMAELIVSDTGPGIPVTERDRIFEAGVRLDRDAKLPGSGIGLSVVRDLVVKHGGKIAVRSSAAGGAEFIVRLPLDLRGRPRDALIVVREDESLDRLVSALREAHRRGGLTKAPPNLLAALDECRAVVLVADAERFLSPEEEKADKTGDGS